MGVTQTVTTPARRGEDSATSGREPTVEIAHLRETYGKVVAVLLVLAGYALAFGLLARRLFRWE